jgi:hypothetical protein
MNNVTILEMKLEITKHFLISTLKFPLYKYLKNSKNNQRLLKVYFKFLGKIQLILKLCLKNILF